MTDPTKNAGHSGGDEENDPFWAHLTPEPVSEGPKESEEEARKRIHGLRSEEKEKIKDRILSDAVEDSDDETADSDSDLIPRVSASHEDAPKLIDIDDAIQEAEEAEKGYALDDDDEEKSSDPDSGLDMFDLDDEDSSLDSDSGLSLTEDPESAIFHDDKPRLRGSDSDFGSGLRLSDDSDVRTAPDSGFGLDDDSDSVIRAMKEKKSDSGIDLDEFKILDDESPVFLPDDSGTRWASDSSLNLDEIGDVESDSGIHVDSPTLSDSDDDSQVIDDVDDEEIYTAELADTELPKPPSKWEATMAWISKTPERIKSRWQKVKGGLTSGKEKATISLANAKENIKATLTSAKKNSIAGIAYAKEKTGPFRAETSKKAKPFLKSSPWSTLAGAPAGLAAGSVLSYPLINAVALGAPLETFVGLPLVGAGSAISDGVRTWIARKNAKDVDEEISDLLKIKEDLINTDEEQTAAQIVEKLNILDPKHFPIFATEEQYAQEVFNKIEPVLSQDQEKNLLQKKIGTNFIKNELTYKQLGSDLYKSYESLLDTPEAGVRNVKYKKEHPKKEGELGSHVAKKPEELDPLNSARIQEISVQLGRMMYTYHSKRNHFGRALGLGTAVTAGFATGAILPVAVAGAYEAGKMTYNYFRRSQSHLEFNSKGQIVNTKDGSQKLKLPVEKEEHDEHEEAMDREDLAELKQELERAYSEYREAYRAHGQIDAKIKRLRPAEDPLVAERQNIIDANGGDETKLSPEVKKEIKSLDREIRALGIGDLQAEKDALEVGKLKQKYEDIEKEYKKQKKLAKAQKPKAESKFGKIAAAISEGKIYTMMKAEAGAVVGRAASGAVIAPVALAILNSIPVVGNVLSHVVPTTPTTLAFAGVSGAALVTVRYLWNRLTGVVHQAPTPRDDQSKKKEKD